MTIPRSRCASFKARFIEEAFEAEGAQRRVVLPLDDGPIEDKPADDNPTDERPPEEQTSKGGEKPRRRRAASVPRQIHPVSGKTVDPAAILELDGSSVIAHFAGRWLPIPYLRFVGRDELQRPKFDAGPSNWARAFIALSDVEPDAPVSITLAFDTSLQQQSRLDAESYLAPNVDDAAFGSTFICAAAVEDLSTLLGEGWLDEWIAAGPKAASVPSGPANFENQHVALYLSLLRLLTSAEAMPEARFTDTIQRRFPVRDTAIDLVVDIGDMETTALLVDVTQDAFGDAATSMGYAEPLRLRDLSQPWLVHEGSFPTAVEFNAAPFGDGNLSRDSGRLDAFHWPSLVRIGNEARRLALRNNGTEGVTGLSNLKSFLLDDNASPGLWRQSTDDRGTGEAGPMVSGTVMDFLGESGAVIGRDPIDASVPLLADQRPAIRPRFSRASLIGFFAAELVMQAIAQANSAARDAREPHESDVRQLRQVVVLAPSSLSPQERQALLSRVDQGLTLAWRGLGWDKAAPGVPRQPAVVLGLGGELGTQIAFLHNEITTKYQGRFRDLLRVYRGGEVAGGGAETLRVASVDFGARLTGLSIVDYAANDAPAVAAEWQPSIFLQERLPVGTDSVLQSLIWMLVLPAIEAHLAAGGLNPARNFLDEITGRSSTSLLVEDPYFTRRLNRKVLWPAANGLLAIHQHGATSLGYGNRAVSLATLVELGGGRMSGIAGAFDTAALQAGARGFALDAVKVDLNRGELRRIIQSEMRDIVQQVCRLVAANACDLLLLGGDGTRLPAVPEAVLSALPVPASRIIDLNTHVNQVAAEAIVGHGQVTAAAMLPAIASALDRRQLLETSGFGTQALRRLAIAPPPEAAGGQRALAAPQTGDDTSQRNGADRAQPSRTASVPGKGA